MTISESNNYMDFSQRLDKLRVDQEYLLTQKNIINQNTNGVFHRWQNPILTSDHVPIKWRYDINPNTNPYLIERIGVNATFNSGAIFWNEKYILVVRVEGKDRKSFFAVAESNNGIDNFRFWERPITLPQTHAPDTNVYDMRLTQHEDGYIYGLFCTERRDEFIPDDVSASEAQCGIARTKDLINWERLNDLKSTSSQQRNVVLHPEFIEGKYALYTRPQDEFINIGSGNGIGWGLTESMESAIIECEAIVDHRTYHTVNESKNGQGPVPLKTPQGWLHLAHGVRNTAAGLRYVLYMFMTDLNKPWKIIHKPAGYFLAPEGSERVGDVSNVVFSNGWIRNKDTVLIYYASSDTRMHVASSTIQQLLDYCINTPEDQLHSFASVNNINTLINLNDKVMKGL